MPADGLTFPVFICCEEQRTASLRALRRLTVFLVGGDHVDWRKAVLYVDSQTGPRLPFMFAGICDADG